MSRLGLGLRPGLGSGLGLGLAAVPRVLLPHDPGCDQVTLRRGGHLVRDRMRVEIRVRVRVRD